MIKMNEWLRLKPFKVLTLVLKGRICTENTIYIPSVKVEYDEDRLYLLTSSVHS